MPVSSPGTGRPASAFYLLYQASHRPDLDTIKALATRGGFSVIYADEDQGLAELLQYGLSFDLSGLAPQASVAPPGMDHSFGLAQQVAGGQAAPAGEWLVLRPGAHLSGGPHLVPVMRAMVELVLALMQGGDVLALGWGPAACVMAPDYARRVLGDWLAGGPFPALGLTALRLQDNGDLVSEGLRFFTGQELRIASNLAQDVPQAGKFAVRLIHSLVMDYGTLCNPTLVEGPQGERLALRPATDGREIVVWEERQAGPA